MRPVTAIFSLFLLGVSFSSAYSAKKSERPNQEKEEEMKERRDIHKPGQMSEGYDHDEDKERQQDVSPDDEDHWYDSDHDLDDEPVLEGYPVQ